MKILITGTNGFLGSQLVKHWEKEHTLFCLSSRKNFNKRLQEAIAQAPWDIILHAGFDIDFSPIKDIDLQSENIQNSTALIDAQNDLKYSKFIFIGAAGVFGVSEDAQERDENKFAECDEKFKSYLQTRYIQEKIYIENVLEQSQIPYTSLCLTTVYGEGMDPFVRNSLSQNSSFKLLPPGGTSFLALSDFLIACDLAIQKPAAGRIILNSNNLLFKELYQSIHKGMKIITIPSMLFKPCKALFSLSKNSAILESSFGFKYYSNKKAHNALGWKPLKERNEILKSLS